MYTKNTVYSIQSEYTQKQRLRCIPWPAAPARDTVCRGRQIQPVRTWAD